MIAYDTPSGFIITNFPLNQNSKFTRLSFRPSCIALSLGLPILYHFADLSRFPGKTRMKKGWYHYHPAYVLTLLCRLFTVHASFPVQTVRLLWHVPCGWSALRHSLECDSCPSVFLRSTRLNWNRHLPTALFITDPCLHLYFMSCWEKDNKNGKIGNKSGKIFIWMW